MRLQRSEAMIESAATALPNPAAMPEPEVTSCSQPTAPELLTIFGTLDLPIILVDTHGRITRFNHAATAVFGLRVSDIGKLLPKVPLLSGSKEIARLLARVVERGSSYRGEIQSGDRWFILQGTPYGATRTGIEGAVLTFTNVTAFRASIAQAIYDREYTKTILNTVAQPLVVVDSDLRVQTGNRAF